MKVHFTKRVSITIAIVVCGVTVLAVSLALSQTANPNNITGRWNVVGNTTSGGAPGFALQMTQAANGVLSGTIFADQIEGFYIPSVRRVVFVRKLSTGVPVQLYEGYVSQDGLLMGGDLIVWNFVGGGGFGGLDFNFTANKLSDTP
jgi:hypothetical protein